MLKLERKTRSQEVSVSIKECGRLVTPTFLQALGIAFAIHLFGLALFHISPFKIGNVETIFPPVQVRIDFVPLIDSGVLAELENEPTAMPPISEPKLSTPEIPGMPFVRSLKGAAYPKIQKIAAYPFENLEYKNYYSEFIDLDPREPKRKKSVVIRLSGELANKPYSLERGEDEDAYFTYSQKGTEARSLSYRVKVENRTGKIFWYQPITSAEGKKINKFARKVLMSMKFEKTARDFVSEGEVEFEFLVANEGD